MPAMTEIVPLSVRKAKLRPNKARSRKIAPDSCYPLQGRPLLAVRDRDPVLPVFRPCVYGATSALRGNGLTRMRCNNAKNRYQMPEIGNFGKNHTLRWGRVESSRHPGAPQWRPRFAITAGKLTPRIKLRTNVRIRKPLLQCALQDECPGHGPHTVADTADETSRPPHLPTS
jgi:hypothetical protein